MNMNYNEYSRITENDFRKLIDSGVSEEKAIAIYSNCIAFYCEGINKSSFNIIYEILDKNPKIILKAMDYSNENAAIMLASIYCSSKNVKVDEIYKKMIKTIEVNFINSISNLFENEIEEEVVDEIRNFICSRRTKMPKKFLDKVKRYKTNKFLFKFIIGLSSFNVDKSIILNRIIKFFVEIDFVKTLNSIYEIIAPDYHTLDMLCNLDKYLDIPLKYFIVWYAEKFGDYEDINNILGNKFKEDKESFKAAIEISKGETRDLLMSFLVDNNNEYEDELQNKCVEAFVRILNEEDATLDEINACKEFLISNVSFDEVKDVLYNTKFSKRVHWKLKRDLTNELKILDHKSRKMSELYGRAIVLLVVYGRDDCIIDLVCHKNKDCISYKTESFEYIFSILDDFSIPMKTKLNIIDKMISNYDYENRRAIALVPIVKSFLNNDKELVVKNIKYLSVEGRKYLLEIISEEKTIESIKILIKYFGDNSKKVRNRLVELLSDSYEFLDLIADKLNSKRNVERETAVRIISKWSCIIQ